MEVKNLIKLYKILGKENIKIDEDMREHTSFRIGGRAKIMFFPKTQKMLEKTLKFLAKKKIDYVVLSNGTNVLITKDQDVVLNLTKLDKICVMDEKVMCDCGVSLFKLNKFLCDHSLSGLELTYGIPGSVGGGVVQNCGAYGLNLSDKIECVWFFNGEKIVKRKRDELAFAYRTSEFKNHPNFVVTKVSFCLEKGNKIEIETKMNEILSLRKEKQPYEYPSAGSVFKRSDGVIVSKLIDELNLKGFRIGGAMVSTKHAGFIVNYDNATSDDVLMLIEYVKNRVKTKKNIDLETEIVIL